jgi:hypothetical protein
MVIGIGPRHVAKRLADLAYKFACLSDRIISSASTKDSISFSNFPVDNTSP